MVVQEVPPFSVASNASVSSEKLPLSFNCVTRLSPVSVSCAMIPVGLTAITFCVLLLGDICAVAKTAFGEPEAETEAPQPSAEEKSRLVGALVESEEQETVQALQALRQQLDDVLAQQDAGARQAAVQKLFPILTSTPGEIAAKKRQAIEDVFWSVLSSREFLFNH